MNAINANILTNVTEMDDKICAITQRILDHENAILAGRQSALIANERLAAVTKELDAYADRSAATIRTFQDIADETRTQTKEKFQKRRAIIEL